MILVANITVDLAEFVGEYAPSRIEKNILDILSASSHKYRYSSSKQLEFELALRKEIINAAESLNRSGMDFEVFRKSRCNSRYWERTNQGGFVLKDDAAPSQAIQDIFTNGFKYATECATAMIIVYYKALLELYGKDLFDETFPKIHLMNWHHIDKNLTEVGLMQRETDYLPGDRRYFDNPDVSPLSPEMQGENVIDMGNGRFYGHGMGIQRAEAIIRELNENRKRNAKESAYLLDSAGRPDFKKLADILYPR
ncbi:MAG: protein-glutamine gamma-glutamyltransferase [Clostridia bacterium]|nr:protein-glutamine gamma-glutamyltransferase [Clostridia bacterium]